MPLPPMGTSNIIFVIDRSTDPNYVVNYNAELTVLNVCSNYNITIPPADPIGVAVTLYQLQSGCTNDTDVNNLKAQQKISVDGQLLKVLFDQLKSDPNVQWLGNSLITNFVRTVCYPLVVDSLKK